MPGAVQHFLLAERKRSIHVKLHQGFEHLCRQQQVAALHFYGVLFKTHLPIGTDATVSVRKIGQHARNLPILGYAPQTDVGGIRERYQDGHTVATEAQEIESLEGRSKGSRADILDGPYSLIGIDHLVADLKSHRSEERRVGKECRSR